MNPQIEQLKEEIVILQEKLNKLEDIEKRNAIPRMNLETEGKFDIVSYNGENYYRYQFNDKSFSWYKRKHTDDGMMLVRITDGETRFLLEGVWYNDVEMKRAKKGFQPKPQSPEEVEEGLRDAMRQAKKDGVFDEPTKPMDEVMDRLEDKYKQAEDTPKTLYNIIDRWWSDIFGIHSDWDMETSIEDLCDRIQFWILRSKK